MEEIEQPCEVCGGSGFDPAVLQYTYNNKNMAEVMGMTIVKAKQFFAGQLFNKDFDILIQLGLDYLTLGQRLDSFSGGERQRLKLTRALKETSKIIILDEPSTGLHPSDTKKLLSFLHELTDKKNTLLVIEHNLDIIAQADWIIDIGPGAGKFGGTIVFTGTVSELLKDNSSLTAEHLRKHVGLSGVHF